MVVLAAGLSTRYGRLKQLDPLGPGGESIMDYNVFDAVRAGFSNIVYVIRPEIDEAIRRHVHEVVGDAATVDFVHQGLDDLPQGYAAPADRSRPWGTAHATLCAAEVIDGSFGVCNADDLYGPQAMRTLHDQLVRDDGTDASLVGYTLAETLSGVGGVSRGVCVLGADGLLATVSEMAKVRRVEASIMAVAMDGTPMELSGREMASMNLWGFTAQVVGRFRRQFRTFLEFWGSDVEREFYLSTEINSQIQVGASKVRVLSTADRWLGVTHPEDRERARTDLLGRVEAGQYPESLRGAFATVHACDTDRYAASTEDDGSKGAP